MARVSLIGSKGTTLELNATAWQEAIEAAQRQGWKQNGSILGMNTIQAADSSKLAQALRQAGRNGSGEQFIYLADFLQGNTITVDEKEKTGCEAFIRN